MSPTRSLCCLPFPTTLTHVCPPPHAFTFCSPRYDRVTLCDHIPIYTLHLLVDVHTHVIYDLPVVGAIHLSLPLFRCGCSTFGCGCYIGRYDYFLPFVYRRLPYGYDSGTRSPPFVTLICCPTRWLRSWNVFTFGYLRTSHGPHCRYHWLRSKVVDFHCSTFAGSFVTLFSFPLPAPPRFTFYTHVRLRSGAILLQTRLLHVYLTRSYVPTHTRVSLVIVPAHRLDYAFISLHTVTHRFRLFTLLHVHGLRYVTTLIYVHTIYVAGVERCDFTLITTLRLCVFYRTRCSHYPFTTHHHTTLPFTTPAVTTTVGSFFIRLPSSYTFLVTMGF